MKVILKIPSGGVSLPLYHVSPKPETVVLKLSKVSFLLNFSGRQTVLTFILPVKKQQILLIPN